MRIEKFCTASENILQKSETALVIFWRTTRRSHNIFNSSFFPKKNSGNGIAGKGILSEQVKVRSRQGQGKVIAGICADLSRGNELF